jgi:hypothetical protein
MVGLGLPELYSMVQIFDFKLIITRILFHRNEKLVEYIDQPHWNNIKPTHNYLMVF